jgi:hypothetical protein
MVWIFYESTPRRNLNNEGGGEREFVHKVSNYCFENTPNKTDLGCHLELLQQQIELTFVRSTTVNGLPETSMYKLQMQMSHNIN